MNNDGYEKSPHLQLTNVFLASLSWCAKYYLKILKQLPRLKNGKMSAFSWKIRRYMASQGLYFHKARAAGSQAAAAPSQQLCTLHSAAILSSPLACRPRSLLLPADMQGCEMFLPSWENKLVERDELWKEKKGTEGAKSLWVYNGSKGVWVILHGQKDLFQNMSHRAS